MIAIKTVFRHQPANQLSKLRIALHRMDAPYNFLLRVVIERGPERVKTIRI